MVTVNTIEYQEYTSEPLRHYAAIHETKFIRQKDIQMGKVTNDFKRIGHAQLFTTLDVLEALSSGHCAILSNYEIDSNNSFRFVSSSMFAIDVDDDYKITNPLHVLEDLKEICVGLFYTFSHGTKGNRYRLLFQLDKSITDSDDLKCLIEEMIHYLKGKGLPVDAAAKNVTQVVRGGVQGYKLNNLTTTLKVNEWLPRAKLRAEIRIHELEAQRKAQAERMKSDLLEPVTYEELKEMCKKIGYIPSGNGSENTSKWLQIVYAIKNEVLNGVLDEVQGYELYKIVSGKEASESYWNSVSPRGEVTVGTIIHHAKEVGYVRKHTYKQAQQETLETIPIEEIKVEEQLTTEIAKQLIQRNQKLLVDSPTGSGKTTSIMAAFKELASKKWCYYIFTAPTIILSEQIAAEHDVPCLNGNTTNERNTITEKALQGERVFVSTYDKVSKLILYLKDGIDYKWEGAKSEFVICIDEIHEFVGSYGYRYNAIDRLESITKLSSSLIALTGTPEFAFKDNFDSLIKINTGNTKSPCEEFRVFTYNTKTVTGETDANLEDAMLINVIRELLNQTRVLAFINNKDRIKSIAKRLKSEGIQVQLVTSDTKQSETYTSIARSKKISDDVQVVLTTSVLATGLSIDNEFNWTCLVVSDKSSPFFNTSTIKQISNRFRQPYRLFCLYMREPSKDYSDDKRFYVETDYQYKKRIVENYVSYLNEEFTGDELEKFTTSKVEKHNGIYYKSSEEGAVIEFNPMYVRHNSMKRSEQYYSTFRKAFIKEVSTQLGVECSSIVNVNEEAEKNNQDFSRLLAELKEDRLQKKVDDAELRSAFTHYFDEEMYEYFIQQDEKEIELFKTKVHSTQFSAMMRLCPISDYETCKHIGENIKKVADTHVFFNDIVSLVEIAALEYSNKTSVTKKVFQELLKLEGESYPSADFKVMINSTIPKKLNVQASDVKAALKLFHKFTSRPGGTSCTSISPLSIELVIERHKSEGVEDVTVLPEKSVKNTIIKYVYSRNENQQKIFLPAISEKYGIEKYEI